MKKEPFQLRLKWSKEIVPEVLHLAFERVDGEPFEYAAGQFISFHFMAEGNELKRSYSVVTPPTGEGDIEIAASFVKGGPATELLFHLQPGDVLTTTGPYGRLTLQDETPPRYILIGTGTGVTPYHAMLPELGRRIEAFDTQVDIVLGVQRREALLYGDAFLAFAERYSDNARFHACYSRDYPDDAAYYEHNGRIHVLLPDLNPNPEQDTVYLCGNPVMIDEAFEYFKTLDFPVKQVRREKYISV